MRLFGENYFEDFFAKRGFTITSPEQLSIREQLELVVGADEIASTLGSLSHFSLFCKPATKFIMLNKDHDTTVPFQYLINEATGVDWYIVDVAKNFMYTNRYLGVCLIGSTSEWKKSLLERQEAENRAVLCYSVHLARLGWLPPNIEGHVCGSVERNLDIQALRINFSKPFHKVYCSVYYPTEGWTEEVINDEAAGTTGKSKSIFGLKIRLDETGAQNVENK